MLGLGAFIADKRLNAGVAWVGVLGSAAYFGYMWNLFFARTTARLSLRRSVVLVAFLSGMFVWAGAMRQSVWPYCLAMMGFLLAAGLFDVQYNTLVRHLYDESERPRRLSQRYIVIAVAGALLTVVFGKVSTWQCGYGPAFFAAGAMMFAAAACFRKLPTGGEHRMEPFNAIDVARATFRDPRFRRVAIVLTVYGWVGAGSGTLLVLLYGRIGLDEAQVGLLKAIEIAGMLFGLLAVTPFLRFTGGVTNYSLCYNTGAVAIVLFLVVEFAFPGGGTAAFVLLAVGSFIFGLSAAGFVLATQTTAINLAPPGKTTVYVNSLMVVQGLRGMLCPLLVAGLAAWGGLRSVLIVSLIVGIFCAVVVWLPNADGGSNDS